MAINSLPKEISFMILMNLKDIDIQQLLRVSKQFKELARDKVLWFKILTSRNPAYLDKKLFRISRPSRTDLILSNILAVGAVGANFQLGHEGRYLNGPFAVNCYRVEMMMRKSLSKQLLESHLGNRPPIEELRLLISLLECI